MRTRATTTVGLALGALVALACADDGIAPDAARSLDVPAAPLAQAGAVAPDLTGDWTGLVTFVDGDNPEGNASDLVIAAQDKRRVVGSKQIGDAGIHVAGTLSEDGNLNLVGRGVGTSPGATQLRYKLTRFHGGAAALVGGVQLKRHGGVARGGQVLLRQFKFDPEAGIDPPDAAGEWTGAFSSGADGATLDDRKLVLQGVEDGPPTLLRGTLTFRDGYTAIPLEGSIDADGNVVMVALAVGILPCYVVVLEGTLIPGEAAEPCFDDVCPDPEPGEAARIVGTYVVLGAISPNMIVSPNMVIEDSGTFDVSSS